MAQKRSEWLASLHSLAKHCAFAGSKNIFSHILSRLAASD